MIGVIGGNGVAATNRLCQLIEEKITKGGAFRDVQHPEMLIWQATQAPSRSMYLEGRGPSWIEDYVRVGNTLKNCGCKKLCMCCNTAHYAIDILQQKIQLPFYNLLDLVAKKCREQGAKRVGILCTDGLRKVGLYEARFKALDPSIAIEYPEEGFQKMVTLTICNAKNKTRFEDPNLTEEHPYNCLNKVYGHLRNDKGVDCIVLGCTDLSNVAPTVSIGLNDVIVIDSLEVLADAIIADINEKN